MTNREALAEAKRRWGLEGYVRRNSSAPTRDKRRQLYAAWHQIPGWPESKEARLYAMHETYRWLDYPYMVGAWMGYGFLVHGQGDTWETAFADADRRTPREPVTMPTANM